MIGVDSSYIGAGVKFNKKNKKLNTYQTDKYGPHTLMFHEEKRECTAPINSQLKRAES